VFSEVAQKLVQLAVSVLSEAVTTQHADEDVTVDDTSDDPTENSVSSGGTSCRHETSVQLFYTARNMFEMFASFVPVYHQHLLSILPQLAGKDLSHRHIASR